MRFAIFGTVLLAAASASPADAQNPPTAPAAARTVVASAKLPELDAAPVYFCALNVILPIAPPRPIPPPPTAVAGMPTGRGPGALNHEPSSAGHQGGNPGNQPWTFPAFNINPEGGPAVVMEAAPK